MVPERSIIAGRSIEVVIAEPPDAALQNILPESTRCCKESGRPQLVDAIAARMSTLNSGCSKQHHVLVQILLIEPQEFLPRDF